MKSITNVLNKSSELGRGNMLHLQSQVRGKATAVGKAEVKEHMEGNFFSSLWPIKTF